MNVLDRQHDSNWGDPVLSFVVPVSGIDASGDNRLSFTNLLKAAIDHSEREKTPAIFNSEVMKMIVQCKWEAFCSLMFRTMCFGYAVYIMTFTWIVMRLSPDRNRDNDGHSLAWAGWWFVFVYTLLLINRERFQVSVQGFSAYLREDSWNYLDLMQQVVMLTALLLVYWRDGDFSDSYAGFMPVTVQEAMACTSAGCNEHINAIQGVALLCGWLKSMYYLRGFESTASVVNMLNRIFVDMVPFLVVLSFIFIA